MFCRSYSISICALHEMRWHFSDACCDLLFCFGDILFRCFTPYCSFFSTIHKNKVEFKMPDLKWHLSILFLSTFLCFSKPIFCVCFFLFTLFWQSIVIVRVFLFPIFFYTFIVFIFGHIHFTLLLFVIWQAGKVEKENANKCVCFSVYIAHSHFLGSVNSS